MNKTDITRVRHRARRHGMVVAKCRQRRIHDRNLGGLRIHDGRTEVVLAGERYDLDADSADDAIDRLLDEGHGWGRP